MSEKKPFLEINLPFGRTVFYSVDDVDEWVKKELKFWKWPEDFDRHIRHDCNPQNIINAIYSPLHEIDAAVNNIKKNHNEDTINHLVAGLRNKIDTAYKTNNPNDPRRRQLLHSTQPRAQYIHSLIETDPVRAAFVAGYFLRIDLKHDHPTVLDGAVTGILFDLGMKGSCEAERAALEQLRQAWNEERLKAQKTHEDSAQAAEDWKKQTEGDRSQQLEAFSRFMEAKQTEVDEFKKRIESEIAFKGPVTYWQAKAEDHTLKSRWFFGFTFVAFVVVGGAILAAIASFAPDLTLDQVKLQHVGRLAVGATVGIWLIRVLVRNYLSHVHLSHDANERVAMMKTYIALLEAGKLEDRHRNLILQALFRPASTGIIKDDAAPPFMAEWLKRTTGTDT